MFTIHNMHTLIIPIMHLHCAPFTLDCPLKLAIYVLISFIQPMGRMKEIKQLPPFTLAAQVNESPAVGYCIGASSCQNTWTAPASDWLQTFFSQQFSTHRQQKSRNWLLSIKVLQTWPLWNSVSRRVWPTSKTLQLISLGTSSQFGHTKRDLTTQKWAIKASVNPPFTHHASLVFNMCRLEPISQQ